MLAPSPPKTVRFGVDAPLQSEATEAKRPKTASASSASPRARKQATTTASPRRTTAAALGTSPTPASEKARPPSSTSHHGGDNLRKVVNRARNVKTFSTKMSNAAIKKRLSVVAGWQLTDADVSRFSQTFEREEEERKEKEEEEKQAAKLAREQKRLQDALEASAGSGEGGATITTTTIPSVSTISSGAGGPEMQQNIPATPSRNSPMRSGEDGGGSRIRRDQHSAGRSGRKSIMSNSGRARSASSSGSSSRKKSMFDQQDGSSAGGGRVHFGKSKASSEAQIMADKAKRRYERLLLCAEQESAARRIQRWYRETMSFYKAMKEVRTIRRLKKTMNMAVFRWVCKVRAKKRMRAEQHRIAQEKLERETTASKIIQHAFRSFNAKLKRERMLHQRNRIVCEICSVEAKNFFALAIQTWWRQRKGWERCRLALRSIKRMKGTRFTFAVRQFLMHRHARRTQMEVFEYLDTAAKRIQRAFRKHVLKKELKQRIFLRAHELPPFSSK